MEELTALLDLLGGPTGGMIAGGIIAGFVAGWKFSQKTAVEESRKLIEQYQKKITKLENDLKELQTEIRLYLYQKVEENNKP